MHSPTVRSCPPQLFVRYVVAGDCPGGPLAVDSGLTTYRAARVPQVSLPHAVAGMRFAAADVVAGMVLQGAPTTTATDASCQLAGMDAAVHLPALAATAAQASSSLAVVPCLSSPGGDRPSARESSPLSKVGAKPRSAVKHDCHETGPRHGDTATPSAQHMPVVSATPVGFLSAAVVADMMGSPIGDSPFPQPPLARLPENSKARIPLNNASPTDDDQRADPSTEKWRQYAAPVNGNSSGDTLPRPSPRTHTTDLDNLLNELGPEESLLDGRLLSAGFVSEALRTFRHAGFSCICSSPRERLTLTLPGF